MIANRKEYPEDDFDACWIMILTMEGSTDCFGGYIFKSLAVSTKEIYIHVSPGQDQWKQICLLLT